MGDAKPTHPPWPHKTLLFRITWVALRVLFRALFRFRVEGLEQYPPGPAVIVVNHPSALDSLFVGLAVPERILFLAAEEYLTMPFVGWVMRAYDIIPVRRGEVDTSAVKESLRALAAGLKVGVFPEGQVSPVLGPVRRGAALLAAHARVPIIPIALIGTGRVFPLGARFPRLARVTVRIGPALPPSTSDRAGEESSMSAAMSWIAHVGAEGDNA
jgi:1-acyl-sn-glycerol-3-phosphate acyltransferase